MILLNADCSGLYNRILQVANDNNSNNKSVSTLPTAAIASQLVNQTVCHTYMVLMKYQLLGKKTSGMLRKMLTKEMTHQLPWFTTMPSVGECDSGGLQCDW